MAKSAPDCAAKRLTFPWLSDSANASKSYCGGGIDVKVCALWSVAVMAFELIPKSKLIASSLFSSTGWTMLVLTSVFSLMTKFGLFQLICWPASCLTMGGGKIIPWLAYRISKYVLVPQRGGAPIAVNCPWGGTQTAGVTPVCGWVCKADTVAFSGRSPSCYVAASLGGG